MELPEDQINTSSQESMLTYCSKKLQVMECQEHDETFSVICTCNACGEEDRLKILCQVCLKKQKHKVEKNHGEHHAEPIKSCIKGLITQCFKQSQPPNQVPTDCDKLDKQLKECVVALGSIANQINTKIEEINKLRTELSNIFKQQPNKNGIIEEVKAILVNVMKSQSLYYMQEHLNSLKKYVEFPDCQVQIKSQQNFESGLQKIKQQTELTLKFLEEKIESIKNNFLFQSKLEFQGAGKFEGMYYMQGKTVLKQGDLNGKGITFFDDGNRYEGQLKNGIKDGKGVFLWPDGDKYDGDFKNDKMEGKGTYYYANGHRYEGDWKNDKMEGKGTFYWADGDRYEGSFINGQPREGIYYRNDGKKFKQTNDENGKLLTEVEIK